MFETFERGDQELIYEALKKLIEHGGGRGFHNRDRGHLAYRAGAEGRTDSATWGDGPDQNRLYKMLSELSYRLSDVDDGVKRDDLTGWQNFCRFAVQCHQRQHP